LFDYPIRQAESCQRRRELSSWRDGRLSRIEPVDEIVELKVSINLEKRVYLGKMFVRLIHQLADISTMFLLKYDSVSFGIPQDIRATHFRKQLALFIGITAFTAFMRLCSMVP
jgi:hypothetical protein